MAIMRTMNEENKDMTGVLKKAHTLIEALPYIQKFNGKKIVVKYGGSAMLNDELRYNVIKDVALLKLVGLKPIIVHGGGKEISKWLEKVGKKPEFVNGLRVTDEETLEVAEMVLNKINKELVSMMEKNGVKAVGISGKDGGMIMCEKKMPDGKDIGMVGNVIGVDDKLLDTLIDNDFVPVICPIGIGENHEAYNINADDAACGVARAIGAEKLVFLTDIEGIYIDPEDKDTLVSEMDLEQAQDFVRNGVVGGGMLPKLQNCIEAIQHGVARVHILDGRLPHCLLLEFYTEQGIGTAILKDSLF